MFSKFSIQTKYSLVFLLVVALIAAGFIIGIQTLKKTQLRNEARAVAEQVVAFRSWVAASGVVWVDKLSKDFHDYLGKRLDKDGELIFSKNPALATRELSTIANKSATRVTFRVTSDEYRNPSNAPDEFESSALNQFKQDEDSSYFDTTDQGAYRYAQPIYVKQSCLKCHGDPADAPKEVIEKYGDKRAFGYKVGDVRGIISVSVPDVAISEVLRAFINPYTIGLLVFAFFLSFFYTQHSIIRRLKLLAAKTEKIAMGNLDEPIDSDANSADEIHQVAHAIDMARKSLVVAMKHMQKK